MDEVGRSPNLPADIAPDTAAPTAAASDVASPAEAQLHHVQEGLLRDAADRIDPHVVRAAIDEAAAALAQAPVQNFVGILVERAVRERLDLPRGRP